MKSPDIPIDEQERLATLRTANILDTCPEERFDRITRMAIRLFGVSITLVSLVDENRQWFKSKQGLEVCESGRDISFCGHAILGDDVFVIEDARQDLRFRDNPLVTGAPNIRFYAGVPLRYWNGAKLGTLCIIDQQPRQLADDELSLLRDLGKMAENELGAIQLAMVDDLTKIFNRRGFMAIGQNSINLCARQQVPVSMVFFDLNHFKLINDQYGHAEGDRALIQFAELMCQAFRESDVFARLGGDEFAVLLTNTNAQFAVEAIERFRRLVDQHNKKIPLDYCIQFTDGIISQRPDSSSMVDDLLHAADVNMYEKKLSARPEVIFVQHS